jgi:hypothetical protein
MNRYKLILFAMLGIFFTNFAKAQAPKDTAEYPYYLEMMQNDSVNFFTVQRAFNIYYERHHDEDQTKDVKGNATRENEEDEGFALYRRWEYMTMRRMKPDGTRMPRDQVAREMARYKRLHPGK